MIVRFGAFAPRPYMMYQLKSKLVQLINILTAPGYTLAYRPAAAGTSAWAL